jgi:hypothetical protein
MKSIKNRDQDIPDVRKWGHHYCLLNRACVSVKTMKHHLRSCLHLLLFVRFVQHLTFHCNKRLKSIKNRDQDIPDVRMAAEQVRSSLFPAKSRLCWC